MMKHTLHETIVTVNDFYAKPGRPVAGQLKHAAELGLARSMHISTVGDLCQQAERVGDGQA
jgi:hypothetical protein